MPDMTQYSKKDTPAQARERLQWILDVVRENQGHVVQILELIWAGEDKMAQGLFDDLYRTERDALLQPNGILTSEQIELLKWFPQHFAVQPDAIRFGVVMQDWSTWLAETDYFQLYNEMGLS